MMFYAVGLLPFAHKLKVASTFVETYVDDSGCASDLELFLAWIKLLMEEGPKFVHFPEPDKRQNSYLQNWNLMWDWWLFLGLIVSPADTASEGWVIEKDNVWVKYIKSLTKAASLCFSDKISSKWMGLHAKSWGEFRKAIWIVENNNWAFFSSNFFQSDVEQVEYWSSLIFSSCYNEGLGICDAVTTSAIAFQSSIEANKISLESIRSGTTLEISKHEVKMSTVKNQARVIQNKMEETTFGTCVGCMPKHKQRTLKRIKERRLLYLGIYMIPTQDNL